MPDRAPIFIKAIAALTAAIVALRVWWQRQIAKWNRMDRLEGRADKNQADIRRLDHTVSEKTDEIHSLQRKVAALTQQNTDQQHQLDDKQGQIDHLNQQLVVVTRERDEAVAELLRRQGK